MELFQSGNGLMPPKSPLSGFFSFSSFSFCHTKTVSVLGLLGCLPRSTELCSHNKAISLVSVMAMETQRFGRYLSIHMLQSNFNFSLNLILDHLQAASTAVPFFTMQTHGKNTADFVFQVSEPRVHQVFPLLSLLTSQGGSSSLLATAGHSADGRNVALWDTLLPQRKACVTAFKYVLLAYIMFVW